MQKLSGERAAGLELSRADSLTGDRDLRLRPFADEDVDWFCSFPTYYWWSHEYGWPADPADRERLARLMVGARESGRGAFFRLLVGPEPNGVFWAVPRAHGKVAVAGLTVPPPEVQSLAWAPFLVRAFAPVVDWAACLGEDVRIWTPCGQTGLIRFFERNGLRCFADRYDRDYVTVEALGGPATAGPQAPSLRNLRGLQRLLREHPP